MVHYFHSRLDSCRHDTHHAPQIVLVSQAQRAFVPLLGASFISDDAFEVIQEQEKSAFG